MAGQSLLTPERTRIGGIGLTQCALRPPLRQLLVLDRRGGGDIDVETMGRRNRHDRAAGLHHAGRGHHRDRIIRPLDPGDGRAQSHAVAEFGGHGGGDLMAAAREVVLLGAVDDIEHAVQAAGGVDVAHGVQHRDLVRFSAPGHPGHDGHQVAGGGRGTDRAQPAAEADGIQLRRPGRRPRFGDAHGARDPGELPLDAADIDETDQAEGGNGAVVGLHLAAPPDQVGPVVECRGGVAAEIGSQLEYRILGGADERGAQIHRDPGQHGGVGPAADPVAALEDHGVEPAAGEFPCRRQTRQPRPDHDHVMRHSVIVPPTHPVVPLSPVVRGGLG